jgi:hypothetical protein
MILKLESMSMSILKVRESVKFSKKYNFSPDVGTEIRFFYNFVKLDTVFSSSRFISSTRRSIAASTSVISRIP